MRHNLQRIFLASNLLSKSSQVRSFTTSTTVKMSAILSTKNLGTPPYATPDPFLFCVYHKDSYPAGNERMEAPRMGNGQDFDPSAEYRMVRMRMR